MKTLNSKTWLMIYLTAEIILLFVCAGIVFRIDPWMYFHKPLLSEYFYRLGTDEERLCNFGIAKNFDYDAMITGTSMTENFSASECDELFGVKSIKVPVSGGKYNRINDIVEMGLNYHPDMKVVIRGLDINGILFDEESNSGENSTYPLYLINGNLFDDVNYLLNKEALLNYCIEMIIERNEGKEPGIVTFDDYARWNDNYTYGKEAVLAGKDSFSKPNSKNVLLSEEDRELITENIEKNVISVAKEYPNTQFYYFYPPYSVIYWGEQYEKGELKKQIDIERISTGLILDSGCKNIHLFGFADELDITMNLDNYKDSGHYGERVNSKILNDMSKKSGLLTETNYGEYYDRLLSVYEHYDYNSLIK